MELWADGLTPEELGGWEAVAVPVVRAKMQVLGHGTMLPMETVPYAVLAYKPCEGHTHVLSVDAGGAVMDVLEWS